MIRQVLSALLARSSYSEETRSRYDSLFEVSVAPPLGPFPSEQSLLTPPTPNASTAEFVPIVGSFVYSPSGVAFARSLRGEEAQELVNIIDRPGVI